MEDPKVIVLFDGYSQLYEDYSLANCTCTLIKCGAVNIIVDTMTAWDGEKLKTAIENNKIKCEDINYVICTHGHSDHVGCNYLFSKAVHIVGHSISHENKYFNHDFTSGQDYVINSCVKVVATPGHTMQDVSVLVHTVSNGTIAITGDLFEREEDLLNDDIWKSAGSDSEQLQQANRMKIMQIADYIVPGHGPMFKVNKK